MDLTARMRSILPGGPPPEKDWFEGKGLVVNARNVSGNHLGDGYTTKKLIFEGA